MKILEEREAQLYVDGYQASSNPLKLPIPSPSNPTNSALCLQQDKQTSGKNSKGSKGRNSKGSKSAGPAAKRRRVEEAATVIEAGQLAILPVFGSQDSNAYGPSASAGGDLNDVLMFCGGPIWAMAWCPAGADSQGEEAAVQYLAVSSHPKIKTQNPVGSSISGPAVLQIWEVSHTSVGAPQLPPLPRLVYCICHNHGLVWDLKWSPDSLGYHTTSESLGNLGVVYGNGEVQILQIPKPQPAASNVAEPESNSDPPQVGSQLPEKPLFVRMQPEFSLPSKTAPCLGSCLDWLPSKPFDLLLVGAWDGSVMVLRIPVGTQRGSALEVLTQIKADSCPIRSVCWAPPETSENITDKSERHLFVTAGHSSSVKIWDWRDPFQPQMDVSVQISWLMEAKWLHEPGGILFCQDDSSVRFLELDSQHRAPADRVPKSLCVWWGPTEGTTWTCDMDPVSGQVAYGGESGSVIVAPPGFLHKSRSPRPPHVIISSTKSDNGTIQMGGQQPAMGVSGTRPAPRKGEFAEPTCAVHRVRWSRATAVEPQGCWLASGAANGILRCQRISYYMNCYK